MKNVLSIALAVLISATSAFGQGNGFGTPLVEVRTVAGPNKEMVSVFAKDYPYPVKTIQNAVSERLKMEGLKGKGTKNNFTAYMGVKYNPLWDNNFDLYVGYTGSKTAGTVEVLMSTGYANYVDVRDRQAQQRAAEWLESLDLTVRNYIHNQKIADAEDALKTAQKEYDKLVKDKRNLEKKLQENDDAIRRLEAQRTIANEQNSATVDPKVIAKEQKEATKLQNNRTKLSQQLTKTTKDLEKAKNKREKQHDTIIDLKNNRPK